MIRSYTTYNKDFLYIGFNQDSSCFCIGTEKGFTIYKSSPLNDFYIRDMKGGIGFICMFENSNILGLVGGGKRPLAALNKLIIWNDATSKILFEIEVDSRILNVKIKKSLIAIIQKKKIKIYFYDSLENLFNYKNIDTIATPENKNGLFGLNLDPSKNIISYLSKNTGEIIIKIYDDLKKDKEINNKIKKISAHQSEITYMTLNYNGEILATCSEKGTIIRLFSINTGKLIKELRRGTDYAEIYSLNFDKSSNYLICGSSKGTIHIFNVKENKGVKNPKSFLSSLGSYLNIQNEYLQNEWSFSQYHIEVKSKYLVNFVDENSFVIITEDGIYYRCKFNPSTGGECTTLQQKNFPFMDLNDDDFLS